MWTTISILGEDSEKGRVGRDGLRDRTIDKIVKIDIHWLITKFDSSDRK